MNFPIRSTITEIFYNSSLYMRMSLDYRFPWHLSTLCVAITKKKKTIRKMKSILSTFEMQLQSTPNNSSNFMMAIKAVKKD